MNAHERLHGPTGWTAGVVRHGEADPRSPDMRWEFRPERCPEYGHPGVTYHPRMDRTWCQCGDVIRDGCQVNNDFHLNYHSPLMEWWDLEARDRTLAQCGPPPDYEKYRVTAQTDLLALLEGPTS